MLQERPKQCLGCVIHPCRSGKFVFQGISNLHEPEPDNDRRLNDVVACWQIDETVIAIDPNRSLSSKLTPDRYSKSPSSRYIHWPRLNKELSVLTKKPLDFATVKLEDDNPYHWMVTIMGPAGRVNHLYAMQM